MLPLCESTHNAGKTPYRMVQIHLIAHSEYRRIYFYLCYNPENQVKDAKNFIQRIFKYREEILSCHHVSKYEA